MTGSATPWRRYRKAAATCCHLINDVLDISKIEAGRQELNPTCFELQRMTRTLNLMFEERCQHKHLDWLVDAQDLPEGLIWGDEGKLRQVLINLLGNARDASQSGDSITIASQENEHQVLLQVEDQGSGIDKDIKDRLFEPFFTTKEPGTGTGLGLALVYSIIEEHYGQITIDSPVDQTNQRGTRFTITLPRYSMSANGAPA